MKRSIVLVALCALALAACQQRPNQNAYREGEVGEAKTVEYGKVLSARTVDIIGKPSGAGTLVGAGVGGGAASYVGGGSGRTWAIAAGALAGAVAGSAIEQNANDRKGVEYTVKLDSGTTKTIVQDIGEGDVVFTKGARVMLQTGYDYQRVLPAN